MVLGFQDFRDFPPLFQTSSGVHLQAGNDSTLTIIFENTKAYMTIHTPHHQAQATPTRTAPFKETKKTSTLDHITHIPSNYAWPESPNLANIKFYT
jgi:hypothetical protein